MGCVGLSSSGQGVSQMWAPGFAALPGFTSAFHRFGLPMNDVTWMYCLEFAMVSLFNFICVCVLHVCVQRSFPHCVCLPHEAHCVCTKLLFNFFPTHSCDSCQCFNLAFFRHGSLATFLKKQSLQRSCTSSFEMALYIYVSHLAWCAIFFLRFNSDWEPLQSS